MKKSKLADFDNEQIERVVSMAQEERKPFEVIQDKYPDNVKIVNMCKMWKKMIDYEDTFLKPFFNELKMCFLTN